jgi:hypothetical protein
MIPLLKNYFQAVMHKDEIITAFSNAAGALHRFIETQPDEVFEKRYDGKWSAGQHLDHMVRSVKPLNLAYRLPGWGLRLAFGKMNREGRSYEALVERYKSKLSTGGLATGAFVPRQVKLSEKKRLLEQFNMQNNNLCNALNRYQDQRMDEYLLPHPLLGKLSLREMMYFTIYHNEHHLQILNDRRDHAAG